MVTSTQVDLLFAALCDYLNSKIRGFRKKHKIDNIDISDIFVKFVFQSRRDILVVYETH